MTEPKRRRKLNAEQLEVLMLLYKFRFGTNDLFAQYFGKKDRSFVYKRLSILLEQGLIGKRFEPRYRLAGLPAAYYLTPAGARALQERRDPDKPEINIKAIYKDKSVQDEFVWHCLSIFTGYNKLKAQYGERLKFFTKADLNYEQFDYFPQPLPDAYIRLRIGGEEKDCFLDFYYDRRFLSAIQKIRQYATYAEDGEWEDTGTTLPSVLVVCDTSGLQRRLQKRAVASVNNSYSDELVFALTTRSELFSGEAAIWHLATGPETATTLQAI